MRQDLYFKKVHIDHPLGNILEKPGHSSVLGGGREGKRGREG